MQLIKVTVTCALNVITKYQLVKSKGHNSVYQTIAYLMGDNKEKKS